MQEQHTYKAPQKKYIMSHMIRFVRLHKYKQIHLVITILLVLSLSPTIIHAQLWSENMYQSYTYLTYNHYAPFNEVINPSQFDARLLSAAIFYETCRQRALYNRREFQYDYALEVCAHNHTYDMVVHDFFSHTSVVPGKQTMTDRMRQVGYTNVACAENILARSIGSTETYINCAAKIVDQWMHSDGHRRNILNPTYTHLGVGTAIYKKDRWIYVKSTQNFLKK